MSLILSGTDGLSDVDGTAATPAIRGTDANTGIFFPAADTIAFAEGGAEVARFDSSSNLLVGTTSASVLSAGGRGLIELNGSSDSVYSYKAGGSLVGYMLGSASEVRISSFTAIPLTFYTNNTERARIDTSGQMQFTTTQGVAQVSNTVSASIVNGATVDFSLFSGMILVCNYSTGSVGVSITGGGAITLVSSIGSTYGTVTYPGTFDGYRWTNNTGSTYTFSFTAIRYRPNA